MDSLSFDLKYKKEKTNVHCAKEWLEQHNIYSVSAKLQKIIMKKQLSASLVG